ncbi:MAG TPA: hypothetical protein GX728_00025 [Clostridiaceae bacterium]|jgi:hypothetical protein|nr:hypothetical protein [Clostridiaceae bacterium]
MSTSLACMQKNGILNEWYEDICERKAQGITVKEWCRLRHYSLSTYYYRQRQVMQALEQRLSYMESNDPVQFAALPVPSQDNRTSCDAIVIRLGEIEVEIPAGASRESIAAVIEALKC